MNPFNFPFDATTVDPTQGNSPLPVGRHPVVITGNETKATNSQTGGMLVLELSIIDGPAKGQTGTHRLNLWNNNQKAAEIAQRQLSALCHATSRFKLNSFDDLKGVPFIVEVAYQQGHGPDAPQGPENKGYTEVKKVFDINGNEPGKKSANTAPQPAAQSFAPPAQAQAPAPTAPAWNNPAPTQPAPAAAPAWANPAQAQAPASFPPPSAPAAPAWNQAPAPGTPGGKPPWG